MTIAELQKLICAFRDARNWKQFHNGKDMALSLSLEASELLELTQWKSNQEVEQEFRSKPESLSDELADVLYWTLLIANDFDVDLEQALKNKLKKNETKYPVEASKDSKAKYDEL